MDEKTSYPEFRIFQNPAYRFAFIFFYFMFSLSLRLKTVCRQVDFLMNKKEDLQNKKIKAYLIDLRSKEQIKQIAAIKALKIHGNEMVIKPLVEVLIRTDSDKIKAEIMDLLNTIKSSKVPSEIISCLSNLKYTAAHQILLSSIWNSGLDYSEYLKDIVRATVNGDFMEAIECITIIENIEETNGEEQVMESLIILKEYLVAHKEVVGPKMDVLKEITNLLQEINDRL